MNDRHILYATAFVRALATGMIGVLLGFYLSALHLDAASIGLVVGAGLAGAALATLLVTRARRTGSGAGARWSAWRRSRWAAGWRCSSRSTWVRWRPRPSSAW